VEEKLQTVLFEPRSLSFSGDSLHDLFCINNIPHPYSLYLFQEKKKRNSRSNCSQINRSMPKQCIPFLTSPLCLYMDFTL